MLYNSSSSGFIAIWHKWLRRQITFQNATGIPDDQHTLGLVLQDRNIGSRSDRQIELGFHPPAEMDDSFFMRRCHVHRLNPALNLVLG